MKYFFGILGVLIGTMMVIKTEWIVQAFGSSSWAETHLGSSGGTRLMYKLIGVLLIFVSMMGVTGLLGPFIMNTFGTLFNF
ncbi:hypothetical protein KJ641_02135 [Patescibacteria group bacterium]|nr:hypothetical protein [Patescibacteria group bacterium]MBU1895646.1 hypothetical protein [Patescibacteria group bacterium]